MMRKMATFALAATAALALLAGPAPALAEPGLASSLGLAPAEEAAGPGAPDPAGALLKAQATCDGTRERFVEVVLAQPTYTHDGIGRWGENNNKYTRWYGYNGAWCGMFVDWCAREAGVSTDVIATGIGNVGDIKDPAYGTPRWHDWTYRPRPGDLIIYTDTEVWDDADHVGVVVACDDDRYYTREGNRSDDYVVEDYWSYGTHHTGYDSIPYIAGFVSPDFPEPPAPDPYPIPDYDFGPNVSLPQGDGVYSIASTLDKSLFVEVEGGGKQYEARVQLWRGEDEDWRRWHFRRNDDGTYTITAVHSGMALDVRGGSREAGAKVQQFGVHGGDNQKWWLQDCGDGSYALKSVISRGFLDVTGGWDNLGPGVEMEQWSGHGKEESRCSEKFIIERSFGRSVALPQGDRTYSIASVANPSDFVGVSGGSAESGASINVGKAEDRDCKRWNFRRNDDGTYTITAVHSGGVIDVFDGSTENGAKVLQFGRKASGDDNQRWWLEDVGYGVYMLKAKHSGKFLDVKDGSEIVQWRGHGEANQRFVISPSYGPSATLPGGDGVYVIAPADDGTRVVEVEGASESDGANVRAAAWTGGPNQRFRFTREADGAYAVAAAHSGLLLDVWNGEAEAAGRWDCGSVRQRRDGGADSQRFWLEDLGDGTYAVKSKLSGKHLAVDVGDGSNLMQCFGGSQVYANQRFRIEPWVNDLSAAEIAQIAPQPWLGVSVEPRPEVRLGGVTLTEGVDYELSWSGNAWPGEARVTATGIGDYAGSKTVGFVVQGYDYDGWVTLASGAKAYAKGGRLVTGWMDLGSSKYYFQPDGSMSVGWTDVVVNGSTMHYYFNPASGNLVRGTWFEIEGHKYYFRPSGNVAHGWATIADGGVDKKYWFDDDHRMVTGWRDIANSEGRVTRYYFRPSGSMATGWADIDGQKYWFRDSGSMATGFATVSDGYKRYFDGEGRMLVGWQDISGQRFFFRESGAMQVGWATIGGGRYYFRASGAMQTGTVAIDGKWYVFGEDGALVAGPLVAQSEGGAAELG